MRWACALTMVSTVALAGCGEEDPSPFVNEMAWQVYCASGCGTTETHNVTGLDKDSGLSVSCTVTAANTSFSVTDESKGGFDTIQVTGNPDTADCTVTVREGGVEYRDSCTNTPGLGVPGGGCTFTGEATSGEEFMGSVTCTNMQQAGEGNNAIARTLGAGAAVGGPVNIDISNCK